jgi:hypothetical protein
LATAALTLDEVCQLISQRCGDVARGTIHVCLELLIVDGYLTVARAKDRGYCRQLAGLRPNLYSRADAQRRMAA